MKRFNNFHQRPNFQQNLESIGMNYWNLASGPDALPYWQEGVCYGFSETQIDKVLDATQELHDMSIDMVATMVKSGDYPDYFSLTENCKALIEQSWNRGDKSFYGRFDLAYNGQDEIKMLEYNGDTPVSILECSVAQWDYIQQAEGIPNPLRTQYNMLDERMIETWKEQYEPGTLIHFAASGGFRHEDWGNLVYVMDTALRAGMNVKEIKMQDMGLTDNGIFVDLDNQHIQNCFKLYPWEWMMDEQFGAAIQGSDTTWLEPAWKMLLSNKAMLVKLWALNIGHPLLLESYAQANLVPDGRWAKKAIHGREGSNIYTFNKQDGAVVTNELAQGSHDVPDYDKWGYMFQKWTDISTHDGYRPILGSWVIGDQACGMSVREDKNLVTGNDAFFASHIFVPYDHEEEYSHFFK